ncbi:MAG: hypothetical protein EOO42_19280 [Flavobacteriales bacterium]|nr:MAG: hypothetical protein EOO42_19280 [Flavobacteriales bacterium]
MGKSKFLIFLFLVAVKINYALAQEGCAESNIGATIIHPDRIGTSSRFTPNEITRNTITQPSPQCNDFYKSYTVTGGYGSCRYNLFSFTSTTTILNIQGYSVEYVLNCPLDDYIGLLILPLGGIGYFTCVSDNLRSIFKLIPAMI